MVARSISSTLVGRRIVRRYRRSPARRTRGRDPPTRSLARYVRIEEREFEAGAELMKKIQSPLIVV
jgi:hypothetical protein